jgi:SAM-dependent methyltransferase
MPKPFETHLRSTVRAARDTGVHLLTRIGPAQPAAKLERDAAQYWVTGSGDNWQNNSHWKGGSKFDGTGVWEAVGRGHVELYERLRLASGQPPAPLERVVDWGCGGGANAITFAHLTQEIIGVDISAESVSECGRQVAAAGGIPFRGIVASLDNPEAAAVNIPRPVSLFLFLYVLELVPTKEYGLRLMRIAQDLLGHGGQVFAQVKYSTGSWSTRSRRRDYRRDLAGITYRIEEFWTAMTDIGLRPEAVSLVPHNELDERYAYFLLSKLS